VQRLLHFFFVIVSLGLSAKSLPKISLLTFATGNDPHSVFGHTAIRVQDSTTRQDIVYNFGMFDFDTPYFPVKFATGTLDYKLGLQSFRPMLKAYQMAGRQVYEQPLAFSKEQTYKVLRSLSVAYQPENRYYRYGFLLKNCSTEIREILLAKDLGVAYGITDTLHTYRYYLNKYAENMPWLHLGINLALGASIDRQINTYELMFLPDYLSDEIQKANIEETSLATTPVPLLPEMPNSDTSTWLPKPFVMFAILLVAMVLTKSVILQNIFLCIVGGAGIILTVITGFSEHLEVQLNYNILWVNPLALLLVFIKRTQLSKVLLSVLLLSLILTLGIWIFEVQGHVTPFYPILISLFWIYIKRIKSLYEDTTT